MIKILKIFGGLLAFLAILFIIGGILIQPKWEVVRNITIDRSPAKIYENIANLRNWQLWSPWTLEKDKTQVYNYEGPQVGAGAKWLWQGEKMGNGWLEIKEGNESSGIIYELYINMNGDESFINGSILYSYDESLNKTDIVWKDDGDVGSSFLRRWMTLLIKNMLGKEMDEGLAKLKNLVEQSPEDSDLDQKIEQ